MQGVCICDRNWTYYEHRQVLEAIMRKIKELLGLPVLDLSTGKQIGEVKDVVIDAASFRMAGIVLAHANWFHGGTGIATEQIRSIGDDTITIDHESAIADEQEIAVGDYVYLREGMIGKHIVTIGGKTVGTLSDIFVDEETRVLTGYEVSDSVIQDLLDGRRSIPLPLSQNIGEETVIISDAFLQVEQEEKDI
jgi:uncharacterized protein YrrD